MEMMYYLKTWRNYVDIFLLEKLDLQALVVSC
jgi:hypothetical protein